MKISPLIGVLLSLVGVLLIIILVLLVVVVVLLLIVIVIRGRSWLCRSMNQGCLS